MHRKYVKVVWAFCRETWRDKTTWNTRVDGRIILKQVIRVWTAFLWLSIGFSGGLYCSVGRIFIVQLRTWVGVVSMVFVMSTADGE
jgi:hypothetical protein